MMIRKPSRYNVKVEPYVDAIEEKGGHVNVRVRVQPRASRNGISLESDGRIKVVLTAAPVDGAANKALTEFMASVLGVSRSAVNVVRGDKAREKTLAVAGLTAAEVRLRMAKAPADRHEEGQKKKR